MNWISALCELYEKQAYLAGKVEYLVQKRKKGEERIPLVLLPISHLTITAQITVTINSNGEFIKAEAVSNEDKLTIVPVTENSASRTANADERPHPLCDNLRFMASDYTTYYGGKKEKDFAKLHQIYMDQLLEWKDSEYSHPKLEAWYNYLKKGTLIEDLVADRIIELDESGKIIESNKIQNISVQDASVRFRVLAESSDLDSLFLSTDERYFPECWLDLGLQKKYIEYYNSICKGKELCYLSGEKLYVTTLHPKKIRNEGDNAKLISSNDAENFTFRGRFIDKRQACSIGYDTSQKAHNALKWIIRRQGYHRDSLCIVAWESSLIPMPSWYQDTDAICEEYVGLWDDEEETQEENLDIAGIKGGRFRSVIQGYGRRLPDISRGCPFC